MSTLARSRHLVEWCRIPTSGARAVEPFDLDGRSLLAIPQLAYDVPDMPADMNGGDSDTNLLLLQRTAAGYELFQTLSAPGGEDAEFFRIGERAFLAVASIRSGAGPYRFDTDCVIHEWDGDHFEPFQRVPAFAAKQWRHFRLAGRHFLALAQGLTLPSAAETVRPSPTSSQIFEWDGERFQTFQEIPSLWAYNWHAFEIEGEHFLAHADHVEPSRLYRWDGAAFVAHQELAERTGRAFASFDADGGHYLLVGCIAEPSRLLRWDGRHFVEHQQLNGLGAREFAVIYGDQSLYIVRVNFILGTPDRPTTELDSQLYCWRNGELALVQTFPTLGGTDVAVLRDEKGPLIAVSNALSATVRFATDTVIYRFNEQEPA